MSFVKQMQRFFYKKSGSKYANWEPTSLIEIGDFGKIRNYSFEKWGNINDFGISFTLDHKLHNNDYAIRHSANVALAGSVEAKLYGVAAGAALLSFNRKGGLVLHLHGYQNEQFKSFANVCDEICSYILDNLVSWKWDYVVVRFVRNALNNGKFLVSEANKAVGQISGVASGGLNLANAFLANPAVRLTFCGSSETYRDFSLNDQTVLYDVVQFIPKKGLRAIIRHLLPAFMKPGHEFIEVIDRQAEAEAVGKTTVEVTDQSDGLGQAPNILWQNGNFIVCKVDLRTFMHLTEVEPLDVAVPVEEETTLAAATLTKAALAKATLAVAALTKATLPEAPLAKATRAKAAQALAGLFLNKALLAVNAADEERKEAKGEGEKAKGEKAEFEEAEAELTAVGVAVAKLVGTLKPNTARVLDALARVPRAQSPRALLGLLGYARAMNAADAEAADPEAEEAEGADGMAALAEAPEAEAGESEGE